VVRSAAQYNVAIRTGLASGIWVLDIDGIEGAESLRALEGEHGPLPATRGSQTARGLHLWWRTNSPVPCSASRVAPHIDVRADGGYILAPASVHPTGRVYQWTSTAPLAVAPEWLLQLTCKRPPPAIPTPTPTSSGPRRNGSPGAYGRAALEGEIQALANTAPGGRNHALNRASYCLHQLVAGGELAGAEVQQRLLGAADANGLMADPSDGPRSVLRTIESGRRAGMQHPRTRPIGDRP
jgi:hypothetical protein